MGGIGWEGGGTTGVKDEKWERGGSGGYRSERKEGGEVC